ncbi:MAG TPA: antitoxin family protein [Gemmataceae bacterium]|nr:antitoxin family protein [Gemmataceae bacterium]
MTLTVEATYENGVLRPGRPLPLQESEKVEIVIHRPSPEPCNTSAAPTAEERQAALKRLLALQLPASDWEQMEEEIVRGAVE